VNHEKRYPRAHLFFNRILAALCNDLIVHSPAAKTAVAAGMHTAPCRISVVPHGNYINYYPNTIDRAAARKRLAIRNDRRVLLFFGAVKAYKGVVDFTRIFSRQKMAGVEWVIAGTGHDPETVAALSDLAEGHGNIRLHMQFIDPSDVQMYMNAADIVVLPYRETLSSGAVLLAMSFGKPVMASAKGHLEELLDESTGFLYEPECENSVRETLHVISTVSRERLNQMGQRCLARAETFDWQSISRMTYNLYTGKPIQNQPDRNTRTS
jgi:glycosyltransferase involved in cell wall biosynthesis